jgi:CRP-like cAMP-binding protein
MEAKDDLRPLAPWANTLTPVQAAQVKPMLFERRYGSGAIIFKRGQTLSHWCGVAEGLLRLSRDTARGRTIVALPSLAPGAWFGEDVLLRDVPLPYDVVAVRPTRLVYLSGTAFKRLLDESIAFNRFVIDQLGARMERLVEHLEADRLRDPETRIARCLASMIASAPAAGAGIEIEISQEELGRLSGTSRPRTNVAVQRLRDEGLLATGHRRITVLDPLRLRTYGGQ